MGIRTLPILESELFDIIFPPIQSRGQERGNCFVAGHSCFALSQAFLVRLAHMFDRAMKLQNWDPRSSISTCTTIYKWPQRRAISKIRDTQCGATPVNHATYRSIHAMDTLQYLNQVTKRWESLNHRKPDAHLNFCIYFNALSTCVHDMQVYYS